MVDDRLEAPSPETGARLRDSPGFWTTWTAATVSAFGSYVTTLAVSVVVVLTLDGSAAEVGLVRAAGWLPYLLLGLFAGVLADRVRRRPLLVVADLGRGLLLLAIPLLAWAGRLDVGWLVAVMLVYGVLSVMNDAAFQSFVPRLVPTPLLTPAQARLDQSDAVAQASGPALAGALISLLGAPAAVLVDAASFVVSGLLLTRVRVSEPRAGRVDPRSGARGGIWAGVVGDALEGLRWVYRHATLRPFALSTHAWFFFSAIGGAVLAPFALRSLGLGPFSLGLALALAGAGALAGSLGAVRLGLRFGVGRVVVASDLVDAVAWALIALSAATSAGWWLFAVGQLVFGFGLGISNANEMGYRQTVTPDRLQGRMNSTMRSINRAMIVVGAPVGGLLADAFGYLPLVWVTAGGFLVVGVAVGMSRFGGARLDDRYAVGGHGR